MLKFSSILFATAIAVAGAAHARTVQEREPNDRVPNAIATTVDVVNMSLVVNSCDIDRFLIQVPPYSIALFTTNELSMQLTGVCTVCPNGTNAFDITQSAFLNTPVALSSEGNADYGFAETAYEETVLDSSHDANGCTVEHVVVSKTGHFVLGLWNQGASTKVLPVSAQQVSMDLDPNIITARSPSYQILIAR